MKLKIKYNPKIVKKSILWLLLVALVGWFGATIVKSYESGHILSDSKMLESEIPSGDYADYLKIQAGVPETRLDEFDLADYWQYLVFPTLSENIYIDGTTGVASNDAADFNKNFDFNGEIFKKNRG